MVAKRPSIKDVAQLAGVAVGTVSNVLNKPEIVSPQTLELVHDAIEQLGFVRNESARQLRSGASSTIAMVVLDVSNPFFTDLYEGAERFALEHGYSVHLGNSGSLREREEKQLAAFEQQRVRGVLLAPIGDVSDDIERLRSHGVSTVLVDRVVTQTEACFVSFDDVAGGQMALTHLVQQGHRRIAFAGEIGSLRQVQDRLNGARQAAAASSPHAVQLTSFATERLDATSGREIADHIMTLDAASRPTAIFAANDMIALGALQGFVLGGVRVPEDIALIGFDDIDFAASAAVPLSAIRQPRQEMGYAAADLLFRELADLDSGIPHQHKHVTFTPELIVRQSSLKTV